MHVVKKLALGMLCLAFVSTSSAPVDQRALVLRARAIHTKSKNNTVPVNVQGSRRRLTAKIWRQVATQRECSDTSGKGEYWWWQARQQWLHDSTYDEPRRETPTWPQCQDACNRTPGCNVISKGRGRHGGMCVWEQNCNIHTDLEAHSNYDIWVADNVCTCSNGVAATGSDCTRHRSAKCTSCDAGFNIHNNGCRPNICTCAAGTAATGIACSSHNAHICASCTEGYALSPGRQCRRLRSCNGRAHGSTWTVACGSGQRGQRTFRCRDGTTLQTSDTCQVNTCSCENGTPASSCSRHGQRSCTSCNAGFSLANGGSSCSRNTCTCSNGTPRSGSSCTSSSDMCASCITGYQLNGVHCQNCGVRHAIAYSRGCVPSRCEPGYRPQGNTCRSCNVPGAVRYRSGCAASVCGAGWMVQGNGCVCASGYHNRGGNCVANECTCANGARSTGSECTRNGGNICSSCLTGYHLSAPNCLANICQCSNGVALTGSACTRHGGTGMCASCAAGFHKVGTFCQALRLRLPVTVIVPAPVPVPTEDAEAHSDRTPTPTPKPKWYMEHIELIAAGVLLVVVLLVVYICCKECCNRDATPRCDENRWHEGGRDGYRGGRGGFGDGRDVETGSDRRSARDCIRET